MPPLTIAGRPAITPTQTAPPAAFSAPAVSAPTVQAPTQTSGGVDPKYINLAKAFRQVESNGDYSAVGKSGEFGAYQFEPSTWAATAPKYGVNVPLQQATREQQNEVAVKQLQDWGAEHPDWNIGNFASAWNAGPGAPNAYKENHVGVNSQGVSYDTPAYARKVALAYQAIKGGQANQQTPTDSTSPTAATPAPQEDFLTKASNFLNAIFPAKNIGNVIGTEIAKLQHPDQAANLHTDATLGGVLGDVAQNAALFVGGGEAIPAIREASTLGRLGAGALKGAKAGVLAGALGGAGNALSNGGGIGDTASGALTGGLTGAALGGVLGGGLSALPRVAGRVVNGNAQSKASAVEDFVNGKTGVPGFQKAATGAATAETAAAGKVVQGTAEEAAHAAQVLRNVDTTGVKTYAQLSDRLQKEIDQRVSTVDTQLGSNPTAYKIKDLAQKVDSGIAGSKLTRKVNYVEDALGQLKKYYTATRDIKSGLKIQQLINKSKTTGLTAKEVNEIARIHGRDLSGFNVNGELASGLGKQAAENTRTGLKETARSLITGDAARIADKEASGLIKVKGLVDDMQTKVQKLGQRVESRNIVQRLARGLGKVVDLATFGGPKEFVSKVFFPSGVGQKTLDSIGIQEQLERNLKIIERLNKGSDLDIERFLRGVIGATLK